MLIPVMLFYHQQNYVVDDEKTVFGNFFGKITMENLAGAEMLCLQHPFLKMPNDVIINCKSNKIEKLMHVGIIPDIDLNSEESNKDQLREINNLCRIPNEKDSDDDVTISKDVLNTLKVCSSQFEESKFIK